MCLGVFHGVFEKIGKKFRGVGWGQLFFFEMSTFLQKKLKIQKILDPPTPSKFFSKNFKIFAKNSQFYEKLKSVEKTSKSRKLCLFAIFENCKKSDVFDFRRKRHFFFEIFKNLTQKKFSRFDFFLDGFELLVELAVFRENFEIF